MLTQTHYRFRNDDGSEVTATWAAALDAPILFPDANTDFRLRIAAQGSSATDEEELELQYRLNGGAWQTPAGTVLQPQASANVGEGAPTSQQITSGGFVPGVMDEVNAASDVSIAMGTDSTEVEFSLRMLAADVANGDTIEFRLTKTGGGALFAYSVTPTIMVGALFPVPDIPLANTPPVLPTPLGRRRRGGHGGTQGAFFEPFYTDPETITVDKFAPRYDDIVWPKPWRPEGIYAYTEVPVPPDVVEHGWEFWMPQIQRRYAHLNRNRYGTFITPSLQDPTTTTYLTILGTLTIIPTYLGLTTITPTYVGETDFNAEGE